MSFGLFNKEKKKDHQQSSDEGKAVSDYHTPTPFRTSPDPRPWVYSRTNEEPKEDERGEDKQDE